MTSKDITLAATVETFKSDVREALPRLASLGQWPAWVNQEGILERIPSADGGAKASGFDAGIACALGIIPESKQKLAATLHGAYTEQAVEQVRRESADLTADCETTWWLAMCSVCREEEGVTAEEFLSQLDAAEDLLENPDARLAVARKEIEEMKSSFEVLDDGTVYATKDGGLQGAYVLGYEWGVQPIHGLYFIGTFRPSLGLEAFPFADGVDEQGRPTSGPVHDSKQFVKTATLEELAAAKAVVRRHLG